MKRLHFAIKEYRNYRNLIRKDTLCGTTVTKHKGTGNHNLVTCKRCINRLEKQWSANETGHIG